MRVFKTKWFARYSLAEGIDDDALRDAIGRVGRGLIDADLRGGIVKQRLPRRGQGRSSGYRVIILLRQGDLAFFVYGFAKRDRADINDRDLRGFRLLAKEMFRMTDADLEKALNAEAIMEVVYDG